MSNFLRLRTSYALEELEFPMCFARVERRLEERGFQFADLVSEYVNVARRMADVDLFAWHIEKVDSPGHAALAGPLISSYLAAYFGACKALLDAAALFLTQLHKLPLAPREQDLRKGKFWTALKVASPTSHDRYKSLRGMCEDVVLWRDAAVHRAAPLAILHLTTEQRDNWQPEKGLIKIHAVPDWRGGKVGNPPKWLNPLDKHKEWRPRLMKLCELICEDQLALTDDVSNVTTASGAGPAQPGAAPDAQQAARR